MYKSIATILKVITPGLSTEDPNTVPILDFSVLQKKNKAVHPSSDFIWDNIPDVIHQSIFPVLCDEYPPLHLFERHMNMPRAYGQRPHNRYYLALDKSIYHNSWALFDRKGLIKRSALSPLWRSFINQLESDSYKEFASRFLGTSEFVIRFAWHLAFTGCEVSPHVDAPDKLGTHLFYFNRSNDWKADWGGQTVILRDLQNPVANPEFDDFNQYYEASNIGNNTLIFKNSRTAWHGVRPITPPPGYYRKLFTVVFNKI